MLSNYKIHIADADNPLVDVDRPILYKLKKDLEFPRNFYLTLHGDDQDISFQYSIMIELGYARDLRLRDRLVVAAVQEDLDAIKHKYIFFQKEKVEMTTVYQVHSHTKECKFYCARIKGATLPESMTEGWPILEFNDLFEAKEEYTGYLTGQKYGI